ncbi:hypothetical protein BST61_g8149 [Cercospora zeina]
MDPNGNIVRDEEKANNYTRSKIGLGVKGARRRAALEEMEETEESEEYEERSEDDVYSESYRARARERLRNVELSNTFLAATTLAAIQDPVDNALRPDPQSFTQAMRSPDAY